MRVLVFCFACSSAFAQLLRFDVASFKRVEPDPPRGVTRQETPTGVTYHHVTLGNLISIAWGYEHYEIVGPNWRDRPTSVLYSVQAKTSEPRTPAEIKRMVQSLVEERLGLVFHRETRDLPVYALVVDRGGPKFRASQSAGEKSWKMVELAVTRYQRFSMEDLARTLDPPLTSRHVVDETGLPGVYDFTIDLSPYVLDSAGAQKLDARGAIDTEGANVLALPRQLGLRLRPTTRPIEVMVIDRVAKDPIP